MVIEKVKVRVNFFLKMPQLDKFSFVTQVFWLLVLFFSLYIMVLQFMLPALYRILKIRKELVDSLIVDNSKLVDEEAIVKTVYKELFSSGVYKTVDFINLFQKRVQVYKNMCAIFFSKSPVFDNTRNGKKSALVLLSLKKQILNHIVSK